MKKALIITLALFISFNAFSQLDELYKMRLGGGMFYTTDINSVGLSVDGVFEVTEQWEAAITYTHIFKKNNIKWNIFDFDAQYVFYTLDHNTNIYALSGLSFTFYKIHAPAVLYNGYQIAPEKNFTASEVGLNIGAGINYKLHENLNLAPEFRITIMDGSYLRVGATLQYVF